MVLSDRDIKDQMSKGRIVIEPLVEDNIQPASCLLYTSDAADEL